MTTSAIPVTPGSGKNVATFSFTEDAVTKEIQRIALANSAGDALGGFGSILSITRTADTNAYAANDVIGTGTSAGNAVLSLAGIGPVGGGEIQITSASLEIDSTGLISGEAAYRLYLYSGTPNSNLADNNAWDLTSGDRATYLGFIDFGVPIDLGSTLYVRQDGLNAQFTCPAGGALKGYLVTAGAYTPTSARVYVINLHSVAL